MTDQNNGGGQVAMPDDTGGRFTVERDATQSTQVEQARAEAEIKSAFVAARLNPRDETRATRAIETACKRRGFADRAFFAFKRAGSNIRGSSVHFARELARCWGNIDYEIIELARYAGWSEVMVYGLDLEANVRSARKFIVMHEIALKNGQIKPLTSERDIREKVNNDGSRQLREAILNLIPRDIIDHAVDLCERTLRKEFEGEAGKEAKLQLFAAFAETFAVTRGQLEQYAGRPAEMWDAGIMSTLRILFRSLNEGDLTVSEAFQLHLAGNGGQAAAPAPLVSASAIKAQADLPDAGVTAEEKAALTSEPAPPVAADPPAAPMPPAKPAPTSGPESRPDAVAEFQPRFVAADGQTVYCDNLGEWQTRLVIELSKPDVEIGALLDHNRAILAEVAAVDPVAANAVRRAFSEAICGPAEAPAEDPAPAQGELPEARG